MYHRRWFGDLSLAVLVALPLVALALPDHRNDTAAYSAMNVTTADRLPGEGRISLLG